MSGGPERYLRERERREFINRANRAQDEVDAQLDLLRGPGGAGRRAGWWLRFLAWFSQLGRRARAYSRAPVKRTD